MTPKQELLEELETVPSPLIAEVLNFLRFLKTKQPPIDFMEFAGMAADVPDLMDEIAHRREEDFEAIADALADELQHYSNPKPLLSDYAVSREGIYEEHP